MLHLCFAPSLDLLIPGLLADIRRVWTDPFAPPTMIIPSPAIGKWVRMRLADADVPGDHPDTAGLGCVANLEMRTLERFLWNVLKPDQDMCLLDVARLGQVVCALLEPPVLEIDIYQPLRAYLETPGVKEPDPLKRVQLSARIARQFLEYEYNRPSFWQVESRRWKNGMDACWLAGGAYHTDTTGHEPWQRDLYRRAHECLSRTADGVRCISLPHLYRLRREKGVSRNTIWSVPPGAILLFGVSKVSHFHRNVLVEISQMDRVDMTVFLTNPCAEFWEDFDTRRSRRLRRSWNSTAENAGITPRNPGDYGKRELREFAVVHRDHSLLELWGSAGKENIFLWCPQAQWHFDYFSPAWVESDAGQHSLLRTLQYSLLRGQDDLPPRDGMWRDDRSLEVLACPDRGREIEEVRERILDLVKEGVVDRLNEIAVYLPDPGAYESCIQRVFGASRPHDPDHIPFTILGACGGTSLFAAGVSAFLELAEGRFDRAGVFILLRNPVVQASRKFTPDDVSVWENWAAELGIYRGWDRTDREQLGDRGESITDAHTFELGIMRMLMGNLAAGEVELDVRVQGGTAGEDGSLRTRIPPFRDFATTDHDTLETFCSIVQDLHDDTLALRDSVAAGVGRAIGLLIDLIGKWFEEIPEDAGINAVDEERVRRAFLDALPHITLQSTIACRQVIALKELLAHIRGCLPGELDTVSTAWTGGITFAPLKPAMIVPHRVVFAAGLDASAFPGTNEKPGWDLLSHNRIVGDSDRVRDNRFAFLELLHAARERLVLSFRARDMQKEVDLQPASVVLELEGYLGNPKPPCDGESGEGRGSISIRREIPWIVHESFDVASRNGRAHGSWDPAEHAMARLDAAGRRVLHRHELFPGAGTTTQPASASASASASLRTSVFFLRKFFANPLEYHLSKTLGIDLEDDPGTPGATDEPLLSGALEMSGLQREIWTRVLQAVFPGEKETACIDSIRLGEEARRIAADVYAGYQVRGRSPEAQFATMERHHLIGWGQTCAAVTLALHEDFSDHRLIRNAALSLGRRDVPDELMVDMGEYGGCAVACRHGLVLVPRSEENTNAPVGIIGIRKEGTCADNPDLWFAATVQWMAAGDVSRKGRIRMVQLNRAEGGDTMPGLSLASMKSCCKEGHDLDTWFRMLLKAMLVEHTGDHLPFAVIQKLHKNGWECVTTEAVGRELESDHSVYRCYLEAFNLTDARIPDVSDVRLQECARNRFAPMLERWIHE